MIHGLGHLSYPERLNYLNLQSLEIRRTRADLILVHKLCHKLVDFDISKLVDIISDSRLRHKHVFYLRQKEIAVLDCRKYCFINRVKDVWNDLDADVVAAPSTASFKSRLHSRNCLPLYWHFTAVDFSCIYSIDQVDYNVPSGEMASFGSFLYFEFGREPVSNRAGEGAARWL